MWLILKWHTILGGFFLLDSVRYRDDVMTILKSDWSNLRILFDIVMMISSWYRNVTSSCVSFTIYQQCPSDLEGDVTPTLLQYRNVHWAVSVAPFALNLTIRSLVDGKENEKIIVKKDIPTYNHSVISKVFFCLFKTCLTILCRGPPLSSVGT